MFEVLDVEVMRERAGEGLRKVLSSRFWRNCARSKRIGWFAWGSEVFARKMRWWIGLDGRQLAVLIRIGRGRVQGSLGQPGCVIKQNPLRCELWRGSAAKPCYVYHNLICDRQSAKFSFLWDFKEPIFIHARFPKLLSGLGNFQCVNEVTIYDSISLLIWGLNLERFIPLLLIIITCLYHYATFDFSPPFPRRQYAVLWP